MHLVIVFPGVLIFKWHESILPISTKNAFKCSSQFRQLVHRGATLSVSSRFSSRYSEMLGFCQTSVSEPWIALGLGLGCLFQCSIQNVMPASYWALGESGGSIFNDNFENEKRPQAPYMCPSSSFICRLTLPSEFCGFQFWDSNPLRHSPTSPNLPNFPNSRQPPQLPQCFATCQTLTNPAQNSFQ